QERLASTFPPASRVCFDRIRPETSDVRNPGSTIREMLPRSESFSLFASCLFTNDSKTDVADAQRRTIVVIAIGNAQKRRQVVESAAAHDWKVGKGATQGAASSGGGSRPSRIDCGTAAVIVGGV